MNVDKVVQSYESVKAVERVQRAIEFKKDYQAKTGHRPSLVSVIAVAMEAEELAVALEQKLHEANAKLREAGIEV